MVAYSRGKGKGKGKGKGSAKGKGRGVQKQIGGWGIRRRPRSDKPGRRFSVLKSPKTSGSKKAIPCWRLGTQVDEKMCKSHVNCEISIVLRLRHLAAPK